MPIYANERENDEADLIFLALLPLPPPPRSNMHRNRLVDEG